MASSPSFELSVLPTGFPVMSIMVPVAIVHAIYIIITRK
jgi:hypothetical protein